MREKIEGLEHHAHFAADRIKRAHIIGQFNPFYRDTTFLVHFQAVDAADHGGFARTRWPAHHHAFAGGDGKVDIAQHMQRAEPFIDAGQFNGGGRIRFGGGSEIGKISGSAHDIFPGIQRRRWRFNSASNPRLYLDMA